MTFCAAGRAHGRRPNRPTIPSSEVPAVEGPRWNSDSYRQGLHYFPL